MRFSSTAYFSQGTNCVFSNGFWDPWKDLGYTRNDTEKGVYTIMIDGAAHCADMYPSNEKTDKESLKQARIFLGDQLDGYIKACS
ncbi:hypothetical protein AB6A40_011181 [Gnathostoma spinigerum]|uniref:Uncharacterized protein n=1 Tax=Gnathostoma spinigerum TaxID=75299 RepID=A0ABD6F417_9BILA